MKSLRISRLATLAMTVVAGLLVAGCGCQGYPPVYATASSSVALSIAPSSAATLPSLPPPAVATPAPTAAPTVVPTSRAAACTGTADNKQFFADAAHDLSFDVYCAVLSSSWWVSTGSYADGKLAVKYVDSAGDWITLQEGAFCTTSPAACSPGSPLSPSTIAFDGLTGLFRQNAILSGDSFVLAYAVYVNPGTSNGYTMIGRGMTQATFQSMSAAVVKVPRG
jgi:hypothetical protein